jgi:succinate dehydrogenase / fumarate reductase cytochrome b subunit
MVESSPAGRARPLSPHLQVWRWHITLAASILHRATGVALYVGLLILAGWGLALASGRGAYLAYTGVLASVPGRVILFGLTVSLFFHMANGVRHLAWDSGKGFSPASANATALASFGFAGGAAVAVWVILALNGAL